MAGATARRVISMVVVLMSGRRAVAVIMMSCRDDVYICLSGRRAVAAVNEALDRDDASSTLRALNSAALQLSALIQQTSPQNYFYHDELRCMRTEKQVTV